ncbi:hypothetical protein RYZ18_00010 [Roseovarius sp. 10]|uniref:hypothetical protein n=1 Tax=Roseovarius sp. 10 TaxID=3080563 RepID=UPI002955D2ED|nr:hypothetical protein [Roseovarius sp. 10]MDV7199703.1 hypothetical protein [Roseovarius sp. 10]
MFNAVVSNVVQMIAVLAGMKQCRLGPVEVLQAQTLALILLDQALEETRVAATLEEAPAMPVVAVRQAEDQAMLAEVQPAA